MNRVVFVLDINVLVDALLPDRPQHEQALDTIASLSKDRVVISETMLETLAIKLEEFGVDRDTVDDVLDTLEDPETLGLDISILPDAERVTETVYERSGRIDYEDSQVASFLVEVETALDTQAVLITRDNGMCRWAESRHRIAMTPRTLIERTRRTPDRTIRDMLAYAAHSCQRSIHSRLAPQRRLRGHAEFVFDRAPAHAAPAHAAPAVVRTRAVATPHRSSDLSGPDEQYQR